MNNCIYSEIVLIGFGDIYRKILHSLIDIRRENDFHLKVVEHEKYPLSKIEQICGTNGADYFPIEDKRALRAFFESLDNKTLIISAGNKYLFPKSVVGKENLTIVNFHNALLPKFPGRNAPSWAIYEGENVAGATWHVVDADVDSGEILWQGQCNIGNDTKAYELARDIMNEAYKGWEEIQSGLLAGSISGKKQLIKKERKVYLSSDIPSDGLVRYNDSPEYIYRVLRSMDYGFKAVFPRCKIEIEENGELNQYSVKHYSLVKSTPGTGDIVGSVYYIKLDEERYLKIDVTPICGDVSFGFEKIGGYSNTMK